VESMQDAASENSGAVGRETFGWDTAKADALATQLAGYPGPSYKRAYLEGLLTSGRSLLASGNARTAAYCLGKVEAGLREAEAAASAAAALAAADAAQTQVDSDDESGSRSDGAGEGEAGPEADATVATPTAGESAKPRKPRAPRKPKAVGKSVLERLRVDWREQRLRQAQDILSRHGSRLTTLERKAYLDSLTKWNKAVQDAAGSPAASSAARRADHALLDLRRRLYARILKSQKAHIVRLSRPAGSLALVQVHEQFPGPIGPYNDRQNLEGVLTLLAGADPAWVEEFLELYQGLSDLQALIPTVRPDRT
jgi:hypothetical protein